jgi:hypothetical protein
MAFETLLLMGSAPLLSFVLLVPFSEGLRGRGRSRASAFTLLGNVPNSDHSGRRPERMETTRVGTRLELEGTACREA